MANKRNRARRNKKSNNWKIIAKIKSDKKSSNRLPDDHAGYIDGSSQMDVDDDLQGNRCRIGAQSVPFLHFETHIIDERRDGSENASESETNIQGEYEFQPNENYFACFTEDDAVDNQTMIDPFLSDDDSEDDFIDSFEENNPGENNADNFDEEQGEGSSSDEHSITELSSIEEQHLADNDHNEALEKKKNRRIFDKNELFEEIKRIARHSRYCHGDMELMSETVRGLKSTFKLKCMDCGMIRKLESCQDKPNAMDVNEDAVLGITSIGSGFSHLKELFTNLGVPVMGNTKYDDIQKQQQSDWFSAAKESAMQALYEEIEWAKAIGSVDSNGNALIIVISDGGWGKRSYGKSFNSLSGCAVLIGLRTKKIIFYGTRNKYCHTCAIAESKGEEVKQHECNKNFSGPSSAMEADIITEGFVSSEEHNARYHQLVADGDSNTYKQLRDLRVYTNPDIFIEKFECVNHLHRNFRAKFKFLSTVSKFDIELRKHIKPGKGNEISKGIKSAAKYWRESTLSTSEKIRGLEDDIMNAPCHYFGVHDKCKSYFCKKKSSVGATENLQLLKDDGIFYEVLNLCQHYFAENAKSLLANYTNNPAEEFNNVVAKYIGGKRINWSLARSYSARVACAVVQYNSKGHASSEFRKHKFGDSDNAAIELLENKRKRKLIANEISRQMNPTRRQDKREKEKENKKKDDYYHGDGGDRRDKEPSDFERAKNVFVDKLKNEQRNRISVEVDSRGGKFNPYWQKIRQDRVPSSFFARIIKTQQRKTYTNLLDELMYKKSELGKAAPLKHQRLVERDALKIFEELFDQHTLQDCGLFIDSELYYLCANPTKLYGQHHILNIKCPLKQYGKRFDVAIREIQFWKNVNGHWELNKQHEWFIELQGELHITGRPYGYVMVWLGEHSGEAQFRIVEIPKDDTYFQLNMKPKLVYFYENVMIKELVDPRKRRDMDLRKYDTATESFV